MSYWKDRLTKSQEKITKKTTKQIEKQLKKYYIETAKKAIDDFEATVNKLATTVGADKEPTPADLYKLDKYWQAQAQLRKDLEKLGDMQIQALSKGFEQNFYNIYNSIDLGESKAFHTLDKAAVQQMLSSIWCADGKSWSQRVWDNTNDLLETLNEGLIHTVAAGKKTSDLKKTLQDRFNVSYSRADALVRTELSHIQTQAAQKRYEDYGVQEVEVWADEDERRCEVCGKLHKKRYPVGAAIPIPAHTNCRCCIVPVVEDEAESTKSLKNKEVQEQKTIPILKTETKQQKLTTRKKYDKITYTQDQLNEINKVIEQVNPKLGRAINTEEYIQIQDLGIHGAEKIKKRQITAQDAQDYINNAILCIKQGEEKILYLSENGVSVVSRSGKLITVYPKNNFGKDIDEILKVVKKYGKKS